MNKPAASVFSRRNLLAVLGLGGAAAAVVAAPPLPLSWRRRSTAGGNMWDRMFFALDRGGMHDWKQQIGTSFTLAGEAGGSTLKLVEVLPLNSKGRRPAGLGRDRAFAAVFEAADGSVPTTDGTYTMQHESHGEIAVFLTPGSPKASAPRLEAVFN